MCPNVGTWSHLEPIDGPQELGQLLLAAGLWPTSDGVVIYEGRDAAVADAVSEECYLPLVVLRFFLIDLDALLVEQPGDVVAFFLVVVFCPSRPWRGCSVRLFAVLHP